MNSITPNGRVPGSAESGARPTSDSQPKRRQTSTADIIAACQPGRRYGRWTIIEHLGTVNSLRRVRARCDCGTVAEHQANNLLRGLSTQCAGCAVDALRRRFSAGDRFGTWRVVTGDPTDGPVVARVSVKCVGCGDTKTVARSTLLGRSPGCRDCSKSELSQWAELAVQNGIHESTFRRRVERGWEVERAVSEGVDLSARSAPYRHKEQLDDGRNAYEVAAEHGISTALYGNRRQMGWTIERAATEPVTRHPRKFDIEPGDVFWPFEVIDEIRDRDNLQGRRVSIRCLVCGREREQYLAGLMRPAGDPGRAGKCQGCKTRFTGEPAAPGSEA